MASRANSSIMQAMVLVAFLASGPLSAAEVEVEIEGVEEEMLANVQAYLGIWQYRTEEDLTDLSIRRLHARARDEIRAALVPFGFYEPEVRARLIEPGEGEDEWIARYAIEPGIPVVVREVNVEIDGPEELRSRLRAVLDASPLREGQRLHHGHYSSLKDALLNRSVSRGHLDARFEVQEMRVDRDAHTASIRLKLVAGTQYVFGDVVFEQDLLNEDFLQRFVEFAPGEPFDYGAMLDLRYGLSDSDYFQSVEVRARKEDDSVRVPILVEAKRNERHRYTFGLGFGTDTGPRAKLGWENRYVNRRGHKARAEIRKSEIDQAFGMSYTIPLKKPRTDRFVLTGSWEDEELADNRAISKTVAGNLIRMLGPWQRTLFLRYEEERATTTSGASATTLVLPGISFLKTSADDPLFPSRGYKLFYELTGAAETLGSDTGFAQLRFQTKRVFTPVKDWRLLLRLELAGTYIDETAELPLTHRYFAGGDRSVRGFDYNRLGPVDADGNVVGGKYLAVGSVEIEHMFTDTWGVAAFVDSGNAADDPDMEFETGVGLGLRWRSPLGMIRFDVAAPLDSEIRASQGVEIHISIGPDL